MNAKNFTKVINPGKIDVGHKNGREFPLYAKIKFKAGELSISGVVGPYQSGNAAGSCGQINMGFKEYDHRGHQSIRDITLAAGWDRSKVKKFFDAWDRWHLNGMNAGCIHQRKLGWSDILLNDDEPKTQKNMATWTYQDTKKHAVSRFIYNNKTLFVHLPKKIKSKVSTLALKDTHKKGVMCKPCPECGYKYGTAWLQEDVPNDVLEFLQSLPNTATTPAWV